MAISTDRRIPEPPHHRNHYPPSYTLRRRLAYRILNDKLDVHYHGDGAAVRRRKALQQLRSARRLQRNRAGPAPKPGGRGGGCSGGGRGWVWWPAGFAL